MAIDELNAEIVLRAYCIGAFPMARSRDGAGGIDWYSPDPRAILPLDDRFHVRRSLAKRVRNGPFTIKLDRAFEAVICACAEPRGHQEETWISDDIIRLFTELHHAGFAHSVEAWMQGQLVGGLYGLAIGGAFFGESMFSREKDASQVCLVHLVHHLRQRGYSLLDVQFANPHLQQFGLVELPREQYLEQLNASLQLPVTWE